MKIFLFTKWHRMAVKSQALSSAPVRRKKMEYRELGRTGWKTSTIGLGTWAMGS